VAAAGGVLVDTAGDVVATAGVVVATAGVVDELTVELAVLVACPGSTTGSTITGRLFFSKTNCKSSANSIAAIEYVLISANTFDSLVFVMSTSI